MVLRQNHKHPGRKQRGTAGFTLIELLLALAMFAVIASVVFAAFAGVMDGVERGQQSMEVYRVGRAALHRMTQEIAAAIRFDTDPQTTLLGKSNTTAGRDQDRIMFVTVPYRRFLDTVPADELCDISYYIAENAQRHLALFREEDCTLDDEREEGGDRLELTDMAIGLDFHYYDAENDSDEWPPDRNDEGPLPCRVRIALTLQDVQQLPRTFITTVALPMRGTCDDKKS